MHIFGGHITDPNWILHIFENRVSRDSISEMTNFSSSFPFLSDGQKKSRVKKNLHFLKPTFGCLSLTQQHILTHACTHFSLCHAVSDLGARENLWASASQSGSFVKP